MVPPEKKQNPANTWMPKARWKSELEAASRIAGDKQSPAQVKNPMCAEVIHPHQAALSSRFPL